MPKSNKSPFTIMVDPSSALEAAQRLSQALPSRTSSLDARKGKAVSDEIARFDAEIEAGR